MEKIGMASQVTSIADTFIYKKTDIVMKHMTKMLWTDIPRMDEAHALAATSAATSTGAQRTFASVVKTTQPTTAGLSDYNVAAAIKDENMRKTIEALKI